MARVAHTWTRVEKRRVVTSHWGFSYPIVPSITLAKQELESIKLRPNMQTDLIIEDLASRF